MLNTKKIVTIVIAVIVLAIILSSVTVVKPGYIGVVELLGNVWERPLYNGIHLVIPLAQVHKMDTRLQEYTMSVGRGEGMKSAADGIDALTKEGLKVTLDITAWFKIDPAQGPTIYQEIGPDYVTKIVRPTLRTAIRDVVVRFTADNIYSSERDSLVFMINQQAQILSDGKGVIMERILLRNVILPDRVQDEIDSKLAADQEAQKMEFVLEKEKMEKQRKILEAEGIREANQIISEGLTNNYIQWYRIEMLKQLLNSPNNTIVILPEDMNTAPLMLNR